MRLDELINTHRQDLNDTDMVIWKYILQHRELASHISIHELARECCVSSTTIVRFAQKLGLDGFGELKAVLKMEEPDQPHYNTNVIEDLKTFYLKTGEKIFKRNFDSASRLVHEANRVFAFASGYVQANVMHELKRLFFYDHVFFCEIPAREEFYSALETATKDDLFIVISLSGETPIVVEVARELGLRDIPLISITKLHDNTLASLSTVNLYVSPAEFQLYDADDGKHIMFRSMMPYFMLIEVWYVKYRMYVHRLKQKNIQSTI
ncbi:MurR/RpiR family transcriptional regulator [uncultured Mitsuokella sp.]|jgi:RpiR family transcriptional regulator, glv operon transcriptional regulator|uniref:MurR/RpiR family transcriptional regulator n=1 Tax=Mitsuokella sp. TaxID=2049034 RepID=UPI0025EE875E|nr:MurR/RpiR family transcriptional regulator [uncultured Mitsuokella sp.]